MKRIMLLLAAVALLALSLAPVVQAQGQGGAPQDVDETPFPIPAGSVFGNCGFDITAQFSGAVKQIELPDGSFIATSPGGMVTLTNDETGTQETFSITGSFHVSTDPETGFVETVSTGRSLLGDPEAGFVIASGNFSFTIDPETGELIEPLSGEGQLINVCEALA